MTASAEFAPEVWREPGPARAVRPRVRRRGRGGVKATAAVLACALAFPVFSVVAQVASPWGETWAHLAETVLVDYALNTLALCLIVGAGTFAVGTASAWLVTMHEFPGRRLLTYALVLPLAVPAYVIAYAYADALQPAGPVQGALREATGWAIGSYWFPEIRSLWGAGLILTLVLYPYVYLLARAAFLSQSVCALEAGRTLGCGPWGAFRRVALPLAWPAIAGGVALALMETLADYGAVQHFAVQTFATGIFRAWYGFGDRAAAAQLATALLAFVALLLLLERAARGGRSWHGTTNRTRELPRVRLSGRGAAAALLVCGLPPLLGFAAPAIWLGWMTLEQTGPLLTPRFLAAAGSTLTLGLAAAALTVGIAVLIAYARRAAPGRATRAAKAAASLGYALPGSVIAIGILAPLTAFDQAVNAFAIETFGVRTGLVLTGSIAGLLFAYAVRFSAPALSAVQAGFDKVTPSVASAAQILTRGPGDALARVHAPLVAPAALTAALIVFVDVMKELPATLLMRPFNHDTLAVLAYNLASDERLGAAAFPALAIVAAGLLPLIVVMRKIAGSRPGEG